MNRDLVRAWTGHNVRPGLARDRSLCYDLFRAWTGCNVATWSVCGPVALLRPDPCMVRSQCCNLIRVDRWQRCYPVPTWSMYGPVATLRPDPCGPVEKLRPGPCVDRSQRFDLVCARFRRYVLIGLDTCLIFSENWCLVARLKLFKNFIVKIFPQRFLYENYFYEKCFYPFLRIFGC